MGASLCFALDEGLLSTEGAMGDMELGLQEAPHLL